MIPRLQLSSIDIHTSDRKAKNYSEGVASTDIKKMQKPMHKIPTPHKRKKPSYILSEAIQLRKNRIFRAMIRKL